MRHPRSWALLGLTLLAVSFATFLLTTSDGARAVSITVDPQTTTNEPRSIVTAVLMDRDRRSTPDNASHARFGATGLVRCGNMLGTAQLVLRRDLIVTAAHVLIGPRSSGDCVFVPGLGSGHPIPIETSTIRSGSHAPMSQAATRDWAVARLAAPVSAASPYGLGVPGRLGAVTLAGAGNGSPARFGTEACAIRKILQTSADGIRELAIDCSASPGSSGAALLDQRGGIAGIYVGFRSTDPNQSQPYSDTHYNFG